MNKFSIRNGAVQVQNSPDHTPRCIDISTHLIGRTVKSKARFWAAREKTSDQIARGAYVSIGIQADEHAHEIPQRDADAWNPATEQTVYMSVDDARALRDTISAALDCADIK